MEKSRGIVYIALGWEHLRLAQQSIESIIDRTSESYNFLIITNLNIPPNTLIHENNIKTLTIQPIDDDLGISSAFLKTQLHKLSPFDITLYLDTDIRAVDDIKCIWSRVTEGIGLCRAFHPINPSQFYTADSEREFTRSKLDPYNFFQYNTGMFLFTKSLAVEKLFDGWYREWTRFKHHENMAFTRLLLDTNNDSVPVNIPDVYNDFYPNISNESVLVHYIGWYKKYL